MKIRRYFFPMYAGVADDPNGDWVKWEDVKLMLERNKELEERLQELEDNVIRLALALSEGKQR